MQLRRWNELPGVMRTREVRKYYNIIKKRQMSLKIKRLFDIVVASIMLMFLAVPMLVIAVCIKLDSRGPVFFRQERVTQYGRIFRIYKFRTMVVDAPKLGITRVGKVLRKIRADEFPQVFNIINGDMTLVGTRPEVPEYVKKYTKEMYATLLLPAGLTSRTSIAYKDEDKILAGAADPDGAYVKEVLPAKMKYNLEALKKFGFVEDCRVLWDTFTSVTGNDRLSVTGRTGSKAAGRSINV